MSANLNAGDIFMLDRLAALAQGRRRNLSGPPVRSASAEFLTTLTQRRAEKKTAHRHGSASK